MERKIGEIFENNGEWYQCVEGDVCADCAFYEEPCSKNPLYETIGSCRYYRKDATSVIFKKLEKVGEPIVLNGKRVQLFKSLDKENGCCHCCFLDRSRCLISKEKHLPNTFYVEIGKIKEDMEEYKMYDAKEDIPEFDKVVDECLFGEDKLKPFDIQKAREGKPVCTRDGRKARIICFDKADERPIVALISDNGSEFVCEYLINGKCYESRDESADLMMLPEKKEGWVNVYKERVYGTKEEAIKAKYDGATYVDTVNISWEE